MTTEHTDRMHKLSEGHGIPGGWGFINPRGQVVEPKATPQGTSKKLGHPSKSDLVQRGGIVEDKLHAQIPPAEITSRVMEIPEV